MSVYEVVLANGTVVHADHVELFGHGVIRVTSVVAGRVVLAPGAWIAYRERMV